MRVARLRRPARIRTASPDPEKRKARFGGPFASWPRPDRRDHRSTPKPTPPELSEPENAAPMLIDTLSLMRRP